MMGQEASGFSPVRTGPGGEVDVELDADHPGYTDEAYRARRNAIAALALDYEPGSPIPDAEYTEQEHEVWRTVSKELWAKHRTYAVREVLEAKERLNLPADRIPQLGEVTARLEPLTGFRFEPVAGLAPLRQFYESFVDRRFHSTQYIRHHSAPLYTPEPDIVHEVIGHANQLADGRVADLYEQVGRCTARLETSEALSFLSRVFWFTLEFGVCFEGDELRTYGAGLLSSFGELEEFRSAELRDFDWAAMGTQEYDITHYQPVLYAAPSFSAMVDQVGQFLEGFDDEAHQRFLASAA